jgi:alpha-D-ribose 1-methylphosphonate 5-triphosphate diphosphatase
MRLTQAPYHWPLEQAIATVTATPADVAGLSDRGRIAPGKRADIVIFDLVQDRPIIRSVWAAGKRVA